MCPWTRAGRPARNSSRVQPAGLNAPPSIADSLLSGTRWRMTLWLRPDVGVMPRAETDMIRLLAFVQGLGEYGTLTGTAGTAPATFGAVARDASMWISDHRMAVIIGAVVLVGFIYWATRPT